MPEYITWDGSAHEVEMLQTLQMIDMIGDLPPVKIVGVIPYVIAEDSTFQMTDEVIEASRTMEQIVLDYVASLGVTVTTRNPDLRITDVAGNTYIKGVSYDVGV